MVTTSMGAIAKLQRVADEWGAAVEHGERFDVVVPANYDGSALDVAVDPGRWLVEATLPSGEVISEEVAVAAGQDVPVTLEEAEHSPHEWLGWQHLIGNIEGRESLSRLWGRAREGSSPAPGVPGRTGPIESAIPPPAVHLCDRKGGCEVLRPGRAF
jgi:hypothetical protein